MYFNIAVIVGLCLATIACKKEKNESVEITKDCAGTFIQAESGFYMVCNPEILDDCKSGDKVEVDFKKIDCNYDGIVCEKLVVTDGNVKVFEVD